MLEKNGFSILWKIKNFSMLPETGFIKSPEFFIENLNDSTWCIKLHPSDKTLNGFFEICIENVKGCRDSYVSFILSLITAEGPLKLYDGERQRFCLGAHNLSYEKIIRDATLFLPNDCLTVKCHLWNEVTATQPSVICSAVSHVVTERSCFQWQTGAICEYLSRQEGIFYYLPSRAEESPDFKFLVEKNRGDLYMKIRMFDTHYLNDYDGYVIKTKVSVMSTNCELNKTTENRRLISSGEKVWSFKLNFGVKELLDDRELYLFEDILTLYVEIAISINEVWTQIKECNLVRNLNLGLYEKVPKKAATVTYSSSNNSVTNEVGVYTLKDYLSPLLAKNKCTDIVLQTKGGQFNAHRAILSARSPVFHSMFESEMKEKKSGIVEIVDIDASIMKIFLKYLYSGTLNDLKWKIAMPLYFAADKYEISSLRKECSSFLSKNLTPENICDVLIMSDMHQDQELLKATLEIFCVHSKTVLLSSDWLILLQTRPLLAAEALRTMALKMK